MAAAISGVICKIVSLKSKEAMLQSPLLDFPSHHISQNWVVVPNPNRYRHRGNGAPTIGSNQSELGLGRGAGSPEARGLRRGVAINTDREFCQEAGREGTGLGRAIDHVCNSLPAPK